MFGNSFVYSNIGITPETILKNQIGFFNVNFFEDTNSQGGGAADSLIITLRTVVSQVYVTIRDICLVAMLIVMLWVAIKALRSLNPKEKARYKEDFVNCIIGFILIAFSHIIMSQSITIVDMISKSISVSTDDVVLDTSVGNAEHMSEYKLRKIAKENLKNTDVDSVETIMGGAITVTGKTIYENLEKAGYPNVTLVDEPSWWHSVTNNLPWVDHNDEWIVTIQCSSFTEQARYMCQEIYDVNLDGERVNENWNYIGWGFIYIMLVILTVAFAWLYGKRVFYMAALTMFAPVVGVMYPINKQNGSRAYTFNLWFKEYMGSLLMQPAHLFLYSLFFGKGLMDIAIRNPIYVSIAFLAIPYIVKLAKEFIGVPDTKLGGIGKALQETNNVIKKAERATASVAKKLGRTTSRGVRGLVGAYENYRNGSEEEELENNRRPREQELPPEEPERLSGEVEDNNNTELSTTVQRNRNSQNSDDIIDVPYREVDSEPFEQVASSEDQFVIPRNEPLRLEMKDDDIVEGAIALNNKNDLIDGDMSSLFDKQEILDPKTLEMLDQFKEKLSGLSIDLNLSNMTNNVEEKKSLLDTDSDEEIVKTDGERNIYRNKNGDLRLEREEPTDFMPPMSVAMAAGNENNNINVRNDRTMGFDDSLEGISKERLRSENGRTISELGGSNSNITSYGELGNSLNIQDGDNNIRSKLADDSSNIHDNLNVWTNPNEPLPSSKEKPEMKVIDGTKGKNSGIQSSIETNTNSINNIDSENIRTVSDKSISSKNIPNLNESNFSVEEPDMSNVQVKQNNIRTNSRQSGGNIKQQVKMEQPKYTDTNNNINISDIPELNETNYRVQEPDMSNVQFEQNTIRTNPRQSGRNTRNVKQQVKIEQPKYTDTNNNVNINDIPELNEQDVQIVTPDIPREEIVTYSEPRTNTHSTSNTSTNNSRSERIHRLRPDEYQQIPPYMPEIQNVVTGSNINNVSSGNNTDNTGSGNSGNNTVINNNTNTQNTPADNQPSNNRGNATGGYEARTAHKFVDVGENVISRTAGVVGAGAKGVIDMATSILEGDIGGTIGAVTDSIDIATGSPSMSSSRSGTTSSSIKANQSSGTLTREAETIMKKANIPQNEAIALAEACKAVKINNEDNMVLIANVYKEASNSDKSQIVKLSKLLLRMKEDGRSENDAKNTLKNQSISRTTKDLLLKMYDKLHI